MSLMSRMRISMSVCILWRVLNHSLAVNEQKMYTICGTERARNDCAAEKRDELAPSHCLLRDSGQGILSTHSSALKGVGHETGSLADICRAKRMSALPPKADICSATRYVRFVPIADISSLFDYIVGPLKQ